MNLFSSFIHRHIENGDTGDIATNETTSSVPECYMAWWCNNYAPSFFRSPLSKDNIAAFHPLEKAVAEGRYDIVHCHTPLVASITRTGTAGRYVLGGSYGVDDGIFPVQKSFAPQGVVPYYTWHMIFRAAQYNALCAMRGDLHETMSFTKYRA